MRWRMRCKLGGRGRELGADAGTSGHTYLMGVVLIEGGQILGAKKPELEATEPGG